MSVASYSCINKIYHKYFCSVGPMFVQLRWRRGKVPKRKPKWLPMAPSKLFRIPQHPYVSPDEKELMDNLLMEYYRKRDSLGKMFANEIDQKDSLKVSEADQDKIDEKAFQILLKENTKENERIKIIREETLEKLFQEKQLQLLQLEEERKRELQLIKKKVDDIVREEKEKKTAYITQENLDYVIEQAINNPININFAITLDGNIQWEGKPPPEYEEEVQRRISSYRDSQRSMH